MEFTPYKTSIINLLSAATTNISTTLLSSICEWCDDVWRVGEKSKAWWPVQRMLRQTRSIPVASRLLFFCFRTAKSSGRSEKSMCLNHFVLVVNQLGSVVLGECPSSGAGADARRGRPCHLRSIPSLPELVRPPWDNCTGTGAWNYATAPRQSRE
jgi:hypothetical protein